MGKSQSSVSILVILCLLDSPQNPQELFNLRHSSLRNAIERIFGILKKRFKTLTQQLEFPFQIQVRLVKALCCIHNIIRQIGGDDVFDEEWDPQSTCTVDTTSNNNVARRAITITQANEAKAMRDDIAKRMWLSYSRNYRRV
jgi:DDE superfamily endonuclease